MASNVTVIPPKAVQPDILRVAAYCRVSSDSADQLHSYATQIKEYTERINGHAGWELVDVYADEGLTGTRMDKREDFNRMLADCRKGRIDKVLVKSISRFARNTRDCLASLRELSRLGVSVYFEKENIDTGTLTTELMVSVSGSLAQQESISISQNQRMSYRRRMECGEFITCAAPFGYRILDGKKLSIHAEEASLVKWIFQAYLEGQSTEWIAEDLNRRHIPYSQERPEWNKHKVKRLLENPRYIGRDGYPVIVDRERFQTVQTMIHEKTAGYAPKPDRPALRLKDCIRCARCGEALHRLAGKGHRKDTLYLKCAHCAAVVTIADAELLDEVARQWAEYKTPSQEPYQPSGEVIRLTNAINRGLEHPESPEEVVSLILQGASARYDCCPAAAPYENADRPLDVDLNRIRQAVSSITISADNTVAVIFQ